MYTIVRAARIRRAAERVHVSRRYGVLPQSECSGLRAASRPAAAEQSAADRSAGEGETETDACMV